MAYQPNNSYMKTTTESSGQIQQRFPLHPVGSQGNYVWYYISNFVM